MGCESVKVRDYTPVPQDPSAGFRSGPGSRTLKNGPQLHFDRRAKSMYNLGFSRIGIGFSLGRARKGASTGAEAVSR